MANRVEWYGSFRPQPDRTGEGQGAPAAVEVVWTFGGGHVGVRHVGVGGREGLPIRRVSTYQKLEDVE